MAAAVAELFANPDQPWYKPSQLVANTVLVYVALNFGLNYYNSWLLGTHDNQHGLHLPTFYSMCHQVAIITFTSVWTLIDPSMRWDVWPSFRANWHYIVLMGVIQSTSVALNNVSFGYISLTINAIFKASTPFFVVIFSYFIEGKSYSFTVIALVTVIVAGTCLAVPYGRSSVSSVWVGYVLVLLSTIAAAMRAVVGAFLMNQMSGPRLSATAVAFYDASVGFCALLPAAWILELSSIRVLNRDVDPLTHYFSGAGAWENVGLVLGGCAMAGFYGPVTFITIKLTSSLGFCIIGNVKQVLLLLISALVVDHIGGDDPLLWAGLVVVLLASLGYSYQTTVEKRASPAESAVKPKAQTEATPLKTDASGV